jgi:hypothetical protein
MASRSETRSENGDAHDRQVHPTNPPITEEERVVTREREAALRRPFPWMTLAGTVTLVAVAVVAGATAGWNYTIPFAVLGLVIVLFVGGHRAVGLMKTRCRPGRPREEKAPADERDAFPHLGFDERSNIGSTAQHSREEQVPPEMERSTGQR